MAKKWYQNPTVLAALVSGTFVLVGVIITGLFTFYSSDPTHSPDVNRTSDGTEESLNRASSQSSATFESSVRDLNSRLANIERYVGLLAEKRTGIVILIGKQVPVNVPAPLTAHDVAFVLNWAKEMPHQRIGCAFEPNQDKYVVRYFGETQDTSTGQLLFNADKALKEYQMGVRVGGKKVLSSVPGYAPIGPPDYPRDQSEPVFTRIWLADNAVVVFDRNEQATWLEETGLKIKAESLILSEGKMVGVGLAEPQGRFVHSFSSQLDDYIQEEPAFGGVYRLTQLISLARTMSNTLTWINLELTKHHFPEIITPTELPLISIEYRISEQSTIHSVEYHGGVELGKTPSQRESDTLFQSLISQLPLNRNNLILGETVHFDADGDEYVGLVVNSSN